MKKILLVFLSLFLLFSTSVAYANHNSGVQKDNKKCEKSLKYLAKSENTTKEKYKQKYYEKYLKYSKYCKQVEPPNNPPVAYDFQFPNTGVGNAVVFKLTDLPAFDTEDADSKLLTRIIIGNPTGGYLEYKDDGNIYYWLPAQAGTYSFNFKVLDLKGVESNIATVKITVEDSIDF